MIRLNLLMFLIFSFTYAQMPDIKQPVTEAMQEVSVLVGEWQGRGVRLDPSGEKHWSNVKEEIEYKLDKTVLQIEGVGRDEEGRVVHDAMAILYYDGFQKKYKLDSHLAAGLYANAAFEVLKSNEKFQWFFETPAGKVRYTIEISENGHHWHETGEFSPDGSGWIKTFEMDLEKDK